MPRLLRPNMATMPLAPPTACTYGVQNKRVQQGVCEVRIRKESMTRAGLPGRHKAKRCRAAGVRMQAGVSVVLHTGQGLTPREFSALPRWPPLSSEPACRPPLRFGLPLCGQR